MSQEAVPAPDEVPPLEPRDNWVFSATEVVWQSASHRAGVSIEDERRLRAEGAARLQAVGLQLKLPQFTTATAAVLLHRFYMLQSLKTHDLWSMVACCMFIACKVEETLKKTRDVLHAVWMQQFGSKQAFPVEESAVYRDLHETLLVNERILLLTIEFDLNVEHPYTTVLPLVRLVKGTREVAQAAWNYCNDSYRTTLCLQYSAKAIACAMVHMAFEEMKLDPPVSTEGDGRPWWMDHLKEESEKDQSGVQDICDRMRELYSIEADKTV